MKQRIKKKGVEKQFFGCNRWTTGQVAHDDLLSSIKRENIPADTKRRTRRENCRKEIRAEWWWGREGGGSNLLFYSQSKGGGDGGERELYS